MRKNILLKTCCVFAVSAMMTCGVMADEAAVESKLDLVENIKATATVEDLGQVTESIEITVTDIAALGELQEGCFTVNGSSEGVSFETADNVISLTCPGTVIDASMTVECTGAELLFTGTDINEIDNLSVADFESLSYEASNGTTVNYRLKRGTAEGQPLVLFFHGAGECGTDNNAQIVGNRGAVAWAEYTDEAYIMAPQFPEKYSTPYEEGQEEYVAGIIDAVNELVQGMIEDGTVDGNRIYLTGISMGGGVAWEFVTRYPELFAGVVTFAARGTVSEVVGNMDVLEKCAATPVWMYHAAGDIVNSTMNSLDIYKKLVELGNENVHMTIYDAAGIEMYQYFCHFSWVPGLNDSVMMDWLFSQTK